MGGMGCGDQEMFRNCADVQINSIVGAYPPGALSLYSQDSEEGEEGGLVVTAHVCLATQAYTDISGMDEWCQRSCQTSVSVSLTVRPWVVWRARRAPTSS